jgi:AP2-associated kinase
MPSTEPSTSSPAIIGAVQTDTVQQAPCIPEITPMRRGRPTSSTQSNAVHKPSPSPLRNVVSDPFAALDSKSSTAAQTRAKDELSSRFPTLDQFSLLHEPGRKFDFDSTSATSPPSNDLSQRVTEKLADDAFAQPLTHVASAPTSTKPSGGSTGLGISSLTASRQETTGDSPIIHQPTPQRPGRRSQEGEQASFSPNDGSIAAITSRKIYRFPAADQDRSSSKANTEDEDPSRLSTPWSDPWSGPSLYVRPESNSLSGRSLADNHRSKSQTATLPKSPSSSRPSLEGNQPSSLEIENMTNRSKSANSRPRPSSVYLDLHSESRNEKSSSSRRSDPVSAGNPRQSEQSSDIAIDDSNISSDMDYLKAVEGEGLSRRRSGRGSSGSRHRKMGSLPSISLSNAKTLLAGKFGEAFRRFETNTGNEESENRSASPDHARGGLSPIAGSGSHMTSDRSDDGMFGSDAEDVPPEMRRELERRRLSQEERRVAAAGAEYRQRLDKSSDSGRARASGGLTRAKSIQHTVKSLLNETNKPSPTKAAEGYGRFTDRGSSARGGPSESTNNVGVGSPTAPVFRKPLPLPKDDPPLASFTQPPRASSLTYGKTRQHLPQQSIQQKALPPSAPPKPRLLRKGGSDDLSKNSTSTSTSTSISNDTINLSSSPTAAKPTFLAGRPLPPKPSTEGPQSPNGAEDWEKDFSKRYPSLSGLEMVERDITKRSGTGKSVTTRDI